MSRTLKDRPEWVRTNDPREARYENHDHTRLGRPIYRSFPIRDENGNQTYVERSYTAYDYVLTHASDPRGVDFGGYFMREKTIEQTYTVLAFETRLIGYVEDHCTINEPRQPGSLYNSYRNSPCGHYLAFDRPYRNRPEKPYRRAHHSKARRSERNAATKVVKLYNSGEDINFYDDEDLNTRPRLHHGWWD